MHRFHQRPGHHPPFLRAMRLEEQHGSVERAVRDSPPRLPVEAVNQSLADLASPAGGVSAARQQCQQKVGARRLHIAVRLNRLAR